MVWLPLLNCGRGYRHNRVLSRNWEVRIVAASLSFYFYKYKKGVNGL